MRGAISQAGIPRHFATRDWKPVEIDRALRSRRSWRRTFSRSAWRRRCTRRITEPKPGVYIYDFGQNMAGVRELRVQGPAGTDVRLRFAEVLNPDGTIYTENLRTAKATDHFILCRERRGGVPARHLPSTDSAMSRSPVCLRKPANDAVTALVIHTDAPFTAKLKTGSAMINQLWEQHPVGAAIEFCRRADRLPAAR